VTGKKYEDEFVNLHPQLRHTAQYIFEREDIGQNESREQFVTRVLQIANNHCKKTYHKDFSNG
jgi:hypothetical protein